MVEQNRRLRADNIGLVGRLADARVDSTRQAERHQAALERVQMDLDAALARLPAWYERPAVLITATALVTIVAVLGAVRIVYD